MLSERATFNRLVHDYAERKQAEYVRVRSEVPRLRGAGVLYVPSPSGLTVDSTWREETVVSVTIGDGSVQIITDCGDEQWERSKKDAWRNQRPNVERLLAPTSS